MESALSAFLRVLARMEALPASSFFFPDPSTAPRVLFATSITAFKSSALSAFENTAVKLAASCRPRSAEVSITSFMESALSAFCKVLDKMEALLESNFLPPVPSSLPKVFFATSITSFKSSAWSTLVNIDSMFALSFTPISAATATTSFTAPEFCEFSSKLSNISGDSTPISAACSVTSTTSSKFPTKSPIN